MMFCRKVKGVRELSTVDGTLEIEIEARHSGQEATAAEGGEWPGGGVPLNKGRSNLQYDPRVKA
jgi:hypothetical protein